MIKSANFKSVPSLNRSSFEKKLSKIQDFLLELGNGFCFESRQKRVIVGNKYRKLNLVFYNRILKCHILIDLKVRAFSHTDVGQMNFYLNYYKENVMNKGDNPPIGIILCTHKNNTKVHYATAGLDNQLFVSKYMVQLPTPEELTQLLDE